MFLRQELQRRRDELGLSAEQQRLLERVHLDFVRAGARLAPAAQQRYAQVMEQLAGLTTRFAQNVLHDEAAFTRALLDQGCRPWQAEIVAPLRHRYSTMS